LLAFPLGVVVAAAVVVAIVDGDEGGHGGWTGAAAVS